MEEIKIHMKNLNQADVTFPSIFSRFLIGFGSGFIGTIVLGIVLFLSWSIVGETLSPSDVVKNEFGISIQTEAHPLFISIITLAVFLATLVANISYVLLSTMIDEKYSRRATSLTQVFFGNLVILLLMLPAYTFANELFGQMGGAIAGILHLVLGTFFSFFALEALHQSKYLIVNVYGMILGMILFFLIGGALTNSQSTASAFLLMFPVLLGAMALGNRIAEVFYLWLYQNYGKDFLNVDTRFGSDYGGKDSVGLHDFDI
jgi:MFS family permease